MANSTSSSETDLSGLSQLLSTSEASSSNSNQSSSNSNQSSQNSSRTSSKRSRASSKRSRTSSKRSRKFINSSKLTKITKKPKKIAKKPEAAQLYMSTFIEQTESNKNDFEIMKKLQQNQKQLQMKLGDLFKERQNQHQMYSIMITNLRNQQDVMNEQIESYQQQYSMYRNLSEHMSSVISMLSNRIHYEMEQLYEDE